LPEAQRAHFAGAFAATTQCPDNGGNLRNVGRIEFAIRAQYDIALGGKEIGGLPRTPIGFRARREQHQTGAASRFGNREVGV
jgi:hypothetical protein